MVLRKEDGNDSEPEELVGIKEEKGREKNREGG